MQLEPWQTQQILRLRNHFWELQNSVLAERQKVEASLQVSSFAAASTDRASTCMLGRWTQL